MNERVVHFGARESQVGVLTQPPQAPPGVPAFLMCNAGIVHRVGPHRLYVKLAHHIAERGHPAFRLDLPGIGDSAMESDARGGFERVAVDSLRAAMDRLQAELGIDRFIVSGLCSGGQFAFEAARRDPRVVGVVPINSAPHLHDTSDDALGAALQDAALSKHYWRIALRSSFRRKNWRKALGGELDVAARVRVMLGSLGRRETRVDTSGAGELAQARLDELRARDVRILHVYAEGDEWLDYFQMLVGDAAAAWPSDGPLRVEVIERADHTFTLLWAQQRLMERVSDWLRQQGFSVAADSSRTPDRADRSPASQPG